MDILKNPILIGIAAAVIAYFYVKWDMDRKHKLEPKAPRSKVPFLTIGVIGLLAWYISGNYFDNVVSINSTVIPQVQIPQQVVTTIAPITPPIVSTIQNVHPASIQAVETLSPDTASYHLVGKGQITVPNAQALNNALPEMFLELNNF